MQIKHLYCQILLYFTFVFYGYSQITFQAPFGPEGSTIKSLARDSLGNIYCCGTGIFKSTDEGTTWLRINSEPDLHFSCVAIDKNNNIYGGTGYGRLIRSTDGGATWIDINGFMGGVISIFFDSFQNIYVGGNLGLFRSNVNVLSYTQLGIPTNSIYDLDINSDGWLFAATNSGIFSSSDRGFTWIYIKNSPQGVFTLKKNNLGTYFTVNSSGVYRSTDRCSSWTQISTIYGGNSLTIVNGTMLYCSTTFNGVIRSSDNGDSWQQVNSGLDVLNIPFIFSLLNGNLYSCSTLGVYKSTNQGDSWIRKNPREGFVSIRDFAIDSSHNFYVASNSGVMRSSDEGITWSILNNGFTYTDIYFLKTSSSGSIFAGASNAFYRSTNNGNQWTLLNNGIPAESSPQALIALSNGTLIASRPFELYRSINNGDSWNKVFQDNNSGPVTCFAVDPVGTIFALKGFTILYSTNDGQSWSVRYGGANRLNDIAINGVGHIFVTNDNGGTYRSIDCGIHWTKVADALDKSSNWETTLGQNGYVYVSNLKGSLCQSKNNGKSWTDAYKSFSSRLTQLCVDTSGFLYAVTADNGIYKSRVTTVPTLTPNIFYGPGFVLDRIRISRHYDTTITISNIGNGPLSVSVSSTNPLFKIHPESFSVPPYSTFKDTVSFTIPVPGPQSSMLLVSHNSASIMDTFYISATGYGIPRIHFSSDTARFGSIDLGEHKDTTISVINDGDDTLKILSTQISPSVFTKSMVYSPVKPGSSFIFSIRFTPKIAGVVLGKMIFTSNTEAYYDTLYLTASGHPFSILTVMPRRIDFGVVPLGKIKDTTILIQNSGTDTLRIRGMVSNDSLFFVTTDSLTIRPGFTTNIIIRYLPRNFGKDSTTILIYNNSKRPVDTLYVYGSCDTSITNVNQIIDFPSHYMLHQNFPNPFNPSTVIKFNIPHDGFVTLQVFNFLGQEVVLLLHKQVLKGEHFVTWNAEGFPSGIYFYRLRYNSFTETKKLILLR